MLTFTVADPLELLMAQPSQTAPNVCVLENFQIDVGNERKKKHCAATINLNDNRLKQCSVASIAIKQALLFFFSLQFKS